MASTKEDLDFVMEQLSGLFKRSSFNGCYAIFMQPGLIACIQQDLSNQDFIILTKRECRERTAET